MNKPPLTDQAQLQLLKDRGLTIDDKTHARQLIEPRGDWPQRLIIQLQTLPANLILKMGFPADLQTRPIWAAVSEGKRTP